jgi:hypothetical protein
VKTQMLNLRLEFHLDFVAAETNRTGRCCLRSVIEKTILSVLGSDAFSHSLDPLRTSLRRKPSLASARRTTAFIFS